MRLPSLPTWHWLATCRSIGSDPEILSSSVTNASIGSQQGDPDSLQRALALTRDFERQASAMTEILTGNVYILGAEDVLNISGRMGFAIAV